MSSYSQYQAQSGSGSKRTIVGLAILGLHLLIGWAFVTGFVNKIANNIAKDVQVSLIKEQEVKEAPPPPPKPRLDLPPPVSVPTPIVNINIPIEAPAIVTTNRPPPPPAPIVQRAVPATPVTTVRLPECNEDYYPAQAKRLEQEGSVTVKVCVNAANKIEGAIEVVTSSGFPLLDEAAGKCIAQGRYKAGTVDGKPATTCKQLKLTYKLKSAG
jgi:periplasmic protein TonB